MEFEATHVADFYALADAADVAEYEAGLSFDLQLDEEDLWYEEIARTYVDGDCW